jgi:hypothetical protein
MQGTENSARIQSCLPYSSKMKSSEKLNIENFFFKIGAEMYRALKKLGLFRKSKDSKEV